MKSDRDLLEDCRQGSSQAWEMLLDRYERLVFSIPLNYGLSLEDAADISQLTFTILLQSIDKLEHDSRLSSWLATVARRHTWRLLARTRRETTGQYEDFHEQAISLPDPFGGQEMERWEAVEWLEQGFTKLDQRCRHLLQILYFDQEEQSYAEIAALVGMAVGSIGPTRARCLEKLKMLLEDVR